jgi:Na+/proline symporter
VNISIIDLVVIIAYMFGIMLIGVLSVRRKTLTGEVYFLAGRSLKWPVVGAALFASNISTIHLVGLAEGGYKHGVDIVKHFRAQTTDREQVLIGRVTAVVVMLLAMAWSTQGDKFESIFEAINKMPAQFLAPPISVVFVWGVFWRRGTKQAALTTLVLTPPRGDDCQSGTIATGWRVTGPSSPEGTSGLSFL